MELETNTIEINLTIFVGNFFFYYGHRKREAYEKKKLQSQTRQAILVVTKI